MKHLIALILALLTGSAAPSCLPKQLGGSGTEFVSGDSPDGYWVAYWCSRAELYVAAMHAGEMLGLRRDAHGSPVV